MVVALGVDIRDGLIASGGAQDLRGSAASAVEAVRSPRRSPARHTNTFPARHVRQNDRSKVSALAIASHNTLAACDALLAPCPVIGSITTCASPSAMMVRPFDNSAKPRRTVGVMAAYGEIQRSRQIEPGGIDAFVDRRRVLAQQVEHRHDEHARVVLVAQVPERLELPARGDQEAMPVRSGSCD